MIKIAAHVTGIFLVANSVELAPLGRLLLANHGLKRELAYIPVGLPTLHIYL